MESLPRRITVYEFRSFICLANSYKRGGRCIAGIEIDSDKGIILNEHGNPKWIRPVADTQYGEIPNDNASSIKLLSHIGLSYVIDNPQDVHCENVIYETLEFLSFTFPSDTKFLDKLVDKTHKSIFGNHGKAVSVDMALGLDYSLMFIHVQNARAYIDENREKSKSRMCFAYYGTEYDLPITDPAFLEKFRKAPEHFAIIPDVYLTLSLGLEFEGWHHKLVAGVIIPEKSQFSIDAEGVSYMEQQKRIHTNAYAKWRPEDDERLKELYNKGLSVQELIRIFGRNEGAIRSQINKLGVESDIDIPHTFGKEASTLVLTQQEQSNWFTEYESELVRLLDKKAEIEGKINELRQKILKQMENHGLDRINSRQFSVSYTPSKTIMQFDSKAFREEYEELYSNFCKPKQREASIVVKRNKID